MIPVAADYIRDYEQLGFGMFVHLGLYSQVEKGEWSYHIHRLPKEEYMALKDQFSVDSLQEILDTAKAAGCSYVTLTTRHHEGFSLYDTCGLSDFDVIHSPCGRDLVAEFVEGCRKLDMVPFLYHTTLDWTHPDFEDNFDVYLDYLYKSVELLCTRYGKIGGIWFDGNWSKPDADWKEDRLYAMIRRNQPHAIIINNTGLHAQGQIGREEIDAVTFERSMAFPLDRRGMKKYIAGEMCQTLCDHWGAAEDINFKPVKQLIEELCQCRKVGANFLLNIGPNADGTVPKMQQAIMECIGRWMAIYGKAVRDGRPYCAYANQQEFILRSACDPATGYLFKFDPGHCGGNGNVLPTPDAPEALVLEGVDTPVVCAKLMDSEQELPFSWENGVLRMAVPGYPYGQGYCVRVVQLQFQT